ncbi:hypothetical protein vseg_008357 [Gypsophila vaccaria]
MARSKVKLEYIRNDAARRATFKKRKKGLLKKMEELTTLCGVEGCAIVSSPYEDRPEAWPSPSGTRRVLSRLAGLPEEDRGKKMLDQEAYLRHRVSKARQHLDKLRGDVREKETAALMADCLNGVATLECLDWEDVKGVSELAHKTLGVVLESKEAFLNGNGNQNVGSTSGAADEGDVV